jgi:hypothetical protein
MKKYITLLVAAGLILAVSATAGATTFTMAGDYLRVGVSDSGGLIDDNFVVGIDYDITGTSSWTSYDFLKPGIPFEFYSIGYAGSWDAAGYDHGNSFGASSTNTSAGTTNSGTTVGTYGPLSFQQDLWYADDSGFIDFHVTLTNTSTTAVSDVVYARGLDPDQDVYAGGGYPTTNAIPSGDMVYASAPVTDWTIAIFSDSSYAHTPSVQGPASGGWLSDPYGLLTPHLEVYGDYSINMAWDIGTLNPGESAEIYFQYRIAETHGGVDPVIPEPMTMLAIGMGIAGLAGYVRKRKLA